MKMERIKAERTRILTQVRNYLEGRYGRTYSNPRSSSMSPDVTKARVAKIQPLWTLEAVPIVQYLLRHLYPKS
jgi:hypothetical protein